MLFSPALRKCALVRSRCWETWTDAHEIPDDEQLNIHGVARAGNIVFSR